MKVPSLPKGIVPLFETPFLENGAIDYESLPKLIDYSINGGVNGLTAPLVASEVQALTKEERAQIVTLGASAIAGRVPFIVGGIFGRSRGLPVLRQTCRESRCHGVSGRGTKLTLRPD